METLSQAAERLANTLNTAEPKSDTSRMHPHGSTSVDGRWNIPLKEPEDVLPPEMQIKAENPKILGDLVNRHLQNGLPKANALLPSTKPQHSDKEKALLSKTLASVCALQQQYGKTAAELETLVEGFSWVLGDYPIQTIINAIGVHIRKSATIPTPADIENIINPPLPKIDWALYIELKKRLREGRVYVDQDEKLFIRECESIGVNRLRGEMENYNQAQNELARFEMTKLQLLD